MMAVDPSLESCQKKLGSIISGLFVHKGLELGKKLGLVQHLCDKAEEAKTCEEIARDMKYKERYVREWLGAMVAAGIVCMDGSGYKYYITKHMATVLSGPVIDYGSQIMAEKRIHTEIMECCKISGPSGIPFSMYTTDYSNWLAQYRDRYHKENIISGFVPATSGLQEQLGKRRQIHNKLACAVVFLGLMAVAEAGVTVCDVGCGSGTVSILLAQAYPDSTYFGFDIDQEAIGNAKHNALDAGISNICHFHMHSAEELPEDWTSKFHVITIFESCHDMAQPYLCLHECYRVLQIGGMLVMTIAKGHSQHRYNITEKEFRKQSPYFNAEVRYIYSLLHCLPLGLYQDNTPTTRGSGAGMMWGKEDSENVLKQVGFQNITITEPDYDLSCLLFICIKEL